jgi:hypothetical protein
MTLVICVVEMVVLNVTDWAHCPGLGVNVYEPGVVLLTVDGSHEPLIPFCETDGSKGAGSPEHIGGNGLKKGSTNGFTVIVWILEFEQPPTVTMYVMS